ITSLCNYSFRFPLCSSPHPLPQVILTQGRLRQKSSRRRERGWPPTASTIPALTEILFSLDELHVLDHQPLVADRTVESDGRIRRVNRVAAVRACAFHVALAEHAAHHEERHGQARNQQRYA